jgi:D-amino-acid dehydrogenase
MENRFSRATVWLWSAGQHSQGQANMVKTVIVIGAGITGVSTAEWLRRDGVAVTLIDRVAPGAPEQASYGNAGLLARGAIMPVADTGMFLRAPLLLLDPSFPLYLKWRYLPKLFPWLIEAFRQSRHARLDHVVRALEPLANDSVDQHETLAAGTPAAAYLRRGDYAYLYRDAAEMAADAAHNDLLRKHGYKVEERDRAALVANDPGLGPDYTCAAVYPDHGWLTSPGGYVAALAAHLEAGGGIIRQGEVTTLKNETVTLANGEVLSADRIILSAGAWSGKLAGQVGQKARLETERGYHLFLNGASQRPPHPFMVANAKFVVTPMEGGIRCAGIVEFGGLTAPRSQKPLDLLKRRIREVYPDLTWDSMDEWMGFRPTTPDSIPHLGAIPGAENVICAYGSQHIGLTIGPKLGRMAADIALGRRSNLDLGPYRPDRFS